MSTLKEKFLAIKSYDEFDKKREEFRNIDVSDIDIQNHLSKLFGKGSDSEEYKNGIIVEAF